MEIKTVSAVYFSPTGGTKSVAEKVAAAILGAPAASCDVTVAAEDMSFTPEDVVVIAAPVYAGRVPAEALRRFSRLSGGGAAAVLLAVYGNRAYEDALLELRTAAEKQGFRPFAAGAFIARHSIAPEFGAGRPDAADKKKMDDFGAAVRSKLDWARATSELPTVIVPGNRPFCEHSVTVPQPSASKVKCGKCGKCAANCPVGAIPAGDPTKTDSKKCISCMRCVSLCPHYARSVNPLVMAAVKLKLKKVCSERREPETFV